MTLVYLENFDVEVFLELVPFWAIAQQDTMQTIYSELNKML